MGGGGGVEAGEGGVEKQKLWLQDRDRRDGQAASLAAGELCGVALGELGQAGGAEDALAAAPHLRDGCAALLEAERDLFDDRVAQVGHVRGGVLLDHGRARPLVVRLGGECGQTRTGIADDLDGAVLVERLGQRG